MLRGPMQLLTLATHMALAIPNMLWDPERVRNTETQVNGLSRYRQVWTAKFLSQLDDLAQVEV